MILQAQADLDTTFTQPLSTEKKGSIFKGKPGKSFLLSMVIPGVGQIYNKSYWRAPIVWAAVGGVGYILRENTRAYTCRRDRYISVIDMTPFEPKHYCEVELINITDPGRLRLLRDEANQARQSSIVWFSVIWLANGIDAYVDAHLKDFDVDDDLSFEFGSRFDDDPYAPMRVGMFISFQ